MPGTLSRGLYLEEGCSSMFAYCQRILHFAEAVAYKRIQAARAARLHGSPIASHGLRCPPRCAEFPSPRTRLRPLLSRRFLQIQPSAVSREQPAPPAPAQQTQRALTEPLGAERYRVQFTADRELYEQLQELRALMRHQVPDGDLGKILARAVATLLERVRKQKFGETSKPRTARPSRSPDGISSRHIPAAIRRAVSQRDGGRCTYVSAGGRRCDSQEFLEFDHMEAWSRTKAHPIDGITLRCRAHNQQRARLDFGEPHMARFHRRGGDDPPSTGFESSSPRASGEVPHREVPSSVT